MIDGLEAQVGRLAEQLAEDDLREVAAIFTAANCAQPQLMWNPQPSQLPAPAMSAVLARWELGGGRFRAATVQACFEGELASLRDRTVHVTIDDHGELAYASAGRVVVDVLGHDPSGRTLGAMVAGDPAADMLFYAAGYEACRVRQQPFLTFNESPRLKVRAISRLVLPFWDPAATLRSFVTVIATVDRSGALSAA